MRLGFMTCWDPERIAFARQHGFGCVELVVQPDCAFFPGADGWRCRAAEVADAFQESGLRISCLAGFYVNHLDDDPAVAVAHHARVRNTILLAEAMGVPVVAGFAGRVMHADLEASLPRFREVWSGHARFAEDHGVKIAFEHCPMGAFHGPHGGINCICTPAMWDRCFDAVPSPALGLEWDPSHLVCQWIDPVANLVRYAGRVYHVHVKDARIDRVRLARWGLYHPGVAEHCFAGLGETDWPQVIKELYRSGYRGDLNIEGRHDAVYRDHPEGPHLEDRGLLISQRHLQPYLDGA